MSNIPKSSSLKYMNNIFFASETYSFKSAVSLIPLYLYSTLISEHIQWLLYSAGWADPVSASSSFPARLPCESSNPKAKLKIS